MKFSGDEFLETAPKFRKRNKNSSLCVYVLHKTCHQEISLPSRAVAAVTSGLLTIVKTGITIVSYFGNVTASLFALTIVRKFTPR